MARLSFASFQDSIDVIAILIGGQPSPAIAKCPFDPPGGFTFPGHRPIHQLGVTISPWGIDIPGKNVSVVHPHAPTFDINWPRRPDRATKSNSIRAPNPSLEDSHEHGTCGTVQCGHVWPKSLLRTISRTHCHRSGARISNPFNKGIYWQSGEQKREHQLSTE